jgi:hypothetical protein
MDGIDSLYYNGELLPELASNNPSDRNWKFHPGTITTQTTFYDVTAISGDTLTLSSNPFANLSTLIENVSATGGSRTFEYLGQTTTALLYNKNAATIQTAINQLSTVNPGDITVTGTFPNFNYAFSDTAAQWSNFFTINTTALTGGTSTLTRPSEVSIVAGVDPDPSPYPSGIKQNQKLYVVYSSGNNIKVALAPGGTPLVWTSSAYLLTNLKVYPATGGFFDPVQGRPVFFPNLNFTFSGISYVEVNLPAEMSEIEDEPTKFKIFVRGKRVQNYTSSGQLADAQGVAYNPLALPAQTKFFSANNALVALDIMINSMQVELSRIDFPSWVAFRDHCDAVLAWNSGTIEISGNPNFSVTNADSPTLGTVRKTGGSALWDSGALTDQSSTSLDNVVFSGIYRGGNTAIGLTRKTTPPIRYNDTGNILSIHPSLDGYMRVYSGTGIEGGTTVYMQYNPPQIGDVFKVEISGSDVNCYKNNTLFYTQPHGLGAGTTRGFVAFSVAASYFEDLKFFPMAGGSRNTIRFDAHVVFPQETDTATALQQVFARCPDCHWQDVNGKLKFIVGSTFRDITIGDTTVAGDRVLCETLAFDSNSTSTYSVPNPVALVPKSNIVENSFSAYRTPPENKANFLRIELRDLDDPYYTKKYVYNSRDALRDQSGQLIDFGIIPLGVCSQSLADRMGEATMRWGSDLDLFIALKGMPSTYAVSKGDIVKVAHDVTGWGLDNTGEFIVIEDTLDPSSSGDQKTYLLQAYSDEFYSDTNHGAITGAFPVTVSSLTPPPPLTALALSEETRTLPDGTTYSSIVGRATFDSSYPYSQRGRVYWRKATDVDFLQTNIILEQPNTSITEIPFELNFAPVGINEVKVVTETATGVVSRYDIVSSIDISGTMQIEAVDWQNLINTEIIFNYLKKTTGTNAWDASAISTKAFSFQDMGYLQWTVNEETEQFQVGLVNYNFSTSSPNPIYGLRLDVSGGGLPSIVYNGVVSAPSFPPSVCEPGQSFRMEFAGSVINVYQIIGGVSHLIHAFTNTGFYPLAVQVQLYTANSKLPSIQMFGSTEQTTGLKAHWQTLRRIAVTNSGGQEILTKIGSDGWSEPVNSGTFSAERIARSGAVEWIATETSTYRIAGLSEVDAEIANPNVAGVDGIKFGLYTQIGGILTIREMGVFLGTFGYTTGDILRVERDNGVVRYKKNGMHLYTSTHPSSAPLYVDTAFYSSGATLKDFRIKRVGAFASIPYVYPIYLVESLGVSTSRPQDDGNVYFELSGTFDVVEELPIQRAKIRVFDKFGNLSADLPVFTYAGNGLIGSGFHDRLYADPLEEAIYEVKLDNGIGFSAPVFLQGTSMSFTMPTLLTFAQAVQALTCAPVDHSSISLNWTYSGNVDIQYRLDGATWASLATNVSTKPKIATGLVPNTYYEFRAAPTGTTANWSNICRTRTLQAPLSPETSPPPLSLVATLNGTTPTTQVDLSWNRNSTTNTGVKIYQNGSLIYTGSTATEVSKTITGLTANTTYTFKVKNIYAGGDSIDSNVETITTAAVVSASAPSGLSATPISSSRIDLHWINHVSTGNINIEYDDGSGFTSAAVIAATNSTYSHIGLAPSTYYVYRVSNSGLTGYSNEASAFTNPAGGGGGDGRICVLPDTLIWVVVDGVPCQRMAQEVSDGDTILTINANKEIISTKVVAAMWGNSDTIHYITTKKGKTLGCTPSHPILVNMDLGVERAINIVGGDEVLVYNPELEKIELEVVESKETIKGNFKVVIFALEKEHIFISNNIVSHNVKIEE